MTSLATTDNKNYDEKITFNKMKGTCFLLNVIKQCLVYENYFFNVESTLCIEAFSQINY